MRVRTRTPTRVPATATSGSLTVEVLTASSSYSYYRGVYVSTGQLYNNRWYYPLLGCNDASDSCIKIYFTKSSAWNFYTKRDTGTYYLSTASQAQYAEQITSTWYSGATAVGLSVVKYVNPCTTVGFSSPSFTTRTFTENGTFSGGPKFTEASTGYVLFFYGDYFYIGPTTSSVNWRCLANAGTHPTKAGTCQQFTASGWVVQSGAAFQCKTTTSRARLAAGSSGGSEVFIALAQDRQTLIHTTTSGYSSATQQDKSSSSYVAACLGVGSLAVLLLSLALFLAHRHGKQQQQQMDPYSV